MNNIYRAGTGTSRDPGMATSLKLIPAVFALVLVCESSSVHVPKRDIKVRVPDTLIQKLFELTSSEQAKTDVPLKIGKQWHRAKGIYSSGVKLNFHGNLEMAEARRLLDVFDNNMFVTAWVTSSLLEAFRYGRAPRPTDEQLNLALNTFLTHKDKNKAEANSLMSFWPVAYNDTVGYWQSTPDNLLAAFKFADEVPLNLTDAFLRLIGLGDLVKYVDQIEASTNAYLQAFHIPPDFDDTFVNLGLGSLLYQLRDEFPSAWELWSSYNTNITSVFHALKKYAYRPFSTDTNVNSIDPRSYKYLAPFLDVAESHGKDVALVTTWIQNIEELRTEFYKGVGMPFQINNVDATVCANTIFGMTSAVLSGLVSPDILKDPEIAQIYENTSALIAYEINFNMTNRPDLALLYYPSQIEFDWFVSRTVAMMEEAKKKGPLPVPVMDTVYHTLRDVAIGQMTKYVLSKGKHGEDDTIFYDDFLGDGDITHDNKTLERAEDRIFTTAMAANALLYTWTHFNATTGKLHWKEEMTETVKQFVAGCVKWLTQHTLDGNYDPWNAFFSGSGKGITTIPWFYPGNRYEYLNGTAIHNTTRMPTMQDVYAVQGYIPRDEYNTMLNETHFGVPTPLIFNGYNAKDPIFAFFPLWSSMPYTYSSTLLALSTYNNIAVQP